MTDDNEPTIESIADAAVWNALCDGITTVSPQNEAVLQFDPDDGLHVSNRSPSNVVLVRQTVDPDAFDHYGVEDAFDMGFDATKLTDIMDASTADVVEFGWSWDDFRFHVAAGDIDGNLSGVDADAVNGSPTTVPGLKDEFDYCVDVTVNTDVLARAATVADMASDTDNATFRMGGDAGFDIAGVGDVDEMTVHAADSPDFEWNDPAPDDVTEVRHDASYFKEMVALLPDDTTVRLVTGEELPYHIWATRADGRIDTKVMQAPRVDESR